MKTVLVTGASGFLGRILVRRLQGQFRVLSGFRTEQSECENAVALGDLANLPNLGDILDGVFCVIHCAGRAHILNEGSRDPAAEYNQINCEATLNLAKHAAASGVKRFIFLSSIGVNGTQTFGKPFKATDQPLPEAHYAKSKLKAEIELKRFASETDLELVIIRPPLIIGPNPVGNLGTLAKLIETGIPLPFSLATQNRRSLVRADTLCDLISCCIQHPEASGETLLVAEETPMSTRDILETLAEETGHKLLLVPIPTSLLKMALRIVGKRHMSNQLFGDLEVDFAETKNLLKWQTSKLAKAHK